MASDLPESAVHSFVRCSASVKLAAASALKHGHSGLVLAWLSVLLSPTYLLALLGRSLLYCLDLLLLLLPLLFRRIGSTFTTWIPRSVPAGWMMAYT